MTSFLFALIERESDQYSMTPSFHQLPRSPHQCKAGLYQQRTQLCRCQLLTRGKEQLVGQFVSFQTTFSLLPEGWIRYLAVLMIHLCLASWPHDSTRAFQGTLSSPQCTTAHRDTMAGAAQCRSDTSNITLVGSAMRQMVLSFDPLVPQRGSSLDLIFV